jgi:quinol monooxygenase YgiN
MVHVIAIVTTQPGQRANVLELFKANVPNVLAERGCLQYEATVDSSPVLKFQTEFGPDTFVVVEKWENCDALQAHSTAPHMLSYGERVRGLILSRAIHVLTAA